MSNSPESSLSSCSSPLGLLHLLYGHYVPVLRDWHYREVCSECWRLYWDSRPGAWVSCGCQRVPLVPEQLVLIPPLTTFSTSSTGEFSQFFLHFQASPPYHRGVKRLYVLPASSLTCELEGALSAERVPGQSAFAWLRLAVSALLSLPEDAFSPADGVPDLRIQSALELLRRSPLGLSNESISRRVGMSTSSFYYHFKRETGMSPLRYQLGVRLEQASHWLLEDALSIKEIAERCGFADRYHFSKAFRSFFRLSPGEFRRLNHP